MFLWLVCKRSILTKDVLEHRRVELVLNVCSVPVKKRSITYFLVVLLLSIYGTSLVVLLIFILYRKLLKICLAGYALSLGRFVVIAVGHLACQKHDLLRRSNPTKSYCYFVSGSSLFIFLVWASKSRAQKNAGQRSKAPGSGGN